MRGDKSRLMQTECNDFSSILQSALRKIQNVEVMKSDRLGVLNRTKRNTFIKCVKLAMKRMHKNNAYTFWYYANGNAIVDDRVPAGLSLAGLSGTICGPPRARKLLAI